MPAGPFHMEMAQGVRTSLSQLPERAFITETAIKQFHVYSTPHQASKRRLSTHSERGPSPLDESLFEGSTSRQRGLC
jgi:hypothetical protein